MSGEYPTPFRRLLITIPAMIASTMVAVDITIANVALPHMQASLSASQDQIVWVLTSYLVAGAIATPLSGWLADRFGRKLVMTISVAGFTLASAMCGLANDLQTIVLARILQGACGAALVPLSQALLLDINPPEEYAKAMAIFAMGSMAGPILGPTLGGYLTETLSWRWVFFINVPFGIVATIGMLVFLFESRARAQSRFDMFGFMTVSIGLGAFQLMIDRGEHLDWFDSLEIQIYAAIFALAVYQTVIHMFTARDTFLRPELFKDRNFALGSIISMSVGVVAFATLPLIVVMTQSLIGYSAFHTGLIGVPRVAGTLASMVVVTRLSGRVDLRLLLATGLAVTGVSMLMHARLDLYLDERSLIVAGFVQGLGSGFMFVPLSVIVFSTLSPAFRNEGAAMFALTRNVGNAIGISLLQRELVHFTQESRNHLTQGVRPDSPVFQSARPDFDFGDPAAMAGMNAEVVRQAAMVGYVEIYAFVGILAFALIPIVMMMRAGAKPRPGEPLPVME